MFVYHFDNEVVFLAVEGIIVVKGWERTELEEKFRAVWQSAKELHRSSFHEQELTERQFEYDIKKSRRTH